MNTGNGPSDKSRRDKPDSMKGASARPRGGFNYPDNLLLQPIGKLEGVLRLPGSKSLSNRNLLLASVAEGETHLSNLLDSDDVRVMVDALRQLGVNIEGSLGDETVVVHGLGGPFPKGAQRLHLGNAGTAMRPLTAMLAASGGDYRVEGVPRMHERPIGDLVSGLRKLGARIEYLEREGYPPLHIRGTGIDGGATAISGQTSSQFLSALLMAAPLARSAVKISIDGPLVSRPYVAMTIALMSRYGVAVTEHDSLIFEVGAGMRYRSPGAMLVEGDASSASYFLAGAAITGGTVRVEGCGANSIQGDARFADVLASMGATVRWEPNAIEVTGGPLTKSARRLRGIDVNLVDMPDAAITLAVAALFAEGETTLRGIANWRVKETDRMAAVSTELQKLGAITQVGADHLTVRAPRQLQSAQIETYDDHRMAMAFSLAACGGVPVTIRDPSCVAKTFPDYFDALASLTRTATAGGG